jgi:3-hydroxyisobutyrate dehydrogenase-like beta-hydroxyacid dehydrogenase
MFKITSLGFVGLGVMGAPMCSNLANKSGLKVHGFDSVADAAARVASPAFSTCQSLAEVADQAEVIFLSLPAVKQVIEVCRGPGGFFSHAVGKSGKLKILVDMSTSAVKETRELAAEAEKLGIVYLDAPVARLREAARLGTLSIMVGGLQEAYEAVLPHLKCMGSDITHCGAVGAGQTVKILNNMIVFMTAHALSEALLIGREAGVDPKLLFETMALGSSDSFVLRNQGLKALVPGNFPLLAFPTEYAIKDISLALELARDGGVPAEQAARTHALLEKTRDAGYAKEYYPVMIKLIEAMITRPKA